LPLEIKNGVTLHLAELGSGGPLVVMLHGLFIGSVATWFFTAAPALAGTHRVLAYDLRGHGMSERAPRGYDVATMAADLAAVVDGAAAEAPVTLVGHSYGAVVALRYAIDHPDRVAKLALVEAPLPPSRLAELDAFVAQRPEAMAEALPEPLRAAVLGTGRRARRLVDALRFLATETTLLADLRAEGDIEDADLARVACPVLCVYGEQSSCLPAGRRIAAAVRHGELAVLPGGHFLPLETPAPLTSRLVRFLDG
jgi:pimeloyl-ACP methyl ester carboxylesterase